MADTRGVFGLSRAYQRIAKGSWVDPQTVFSAVTKSLGPSPNTAYTCGGAGRESVVDKTTLSDGTTTRIPACNLTVSRQYSAAVGSMNFGYVNAGWSPAISTLERINYSSDTTSAVPGANGIVNRYAAAAAGNTIDGYWAGGSVPGLSSIINRLSYASETYYTTPGTFLPQGKYHLKGAGTEENGFFMGGSTNGVTVLTEVDKLNYAAGTSFRIPGADLPQATAGWAAAAVAAPRSVPSGGIYFAGGRLQSAGAKISTVCKMSYSSETTSLIGTPLSSVRYIFDGTNNSSHGYFSGGTGTTGSFPTDAVSTIDKWDFSNDTTSNLPSSGNLTAGDSSGCYAHSMLGAKEAEKPNFTPQGILSTECFGTRQNTKGTFGSIHGYVYNAYSYPAGHTTICSRVEYETDVVARVPSADFTLSTPAANGKTPFSSPTGFGYFVGGIGPISDIIKLNYATETTTNTPSKMAQPQSVGGGAASDKAGYMLGGSKPGAYTGDCIKIDLASDTSELISSPLSINAGFKGASSTPEAAYARGGVSPGPTYYSRTDKFTFATESPAAVPGANMNIPRSSFGVNGDTKQGYFTAGEQSGAGNNRSDTEKITYASETNQLSTTANRTLTKSAYADGTGNQTQGYMFGGNIAPSLTNYSTVDKLSFASDTFIRNNTDLIQTHYYTAATSALEQNRTVNPPHFRTTPLATTLNQSLSTSGIPNFGYFAGGSGPGSTSPLSSIGKYDFVTDTRLPFTGQLSIARYIGASGSSSTAGYVAMGLSYVAPTYTRHSRIDKLTFATETVGQVTANTVASLQNSCGASSSLAAYFSGGAPGPVSTTQKMPFSDETTVAVPGAALSVARDSPRAAAGSSAMYMCGGTPSVTTVDKLIFSTDTTNVTPSAALNGSRYVGAMVGNATHGYYGGGLRYTGSYIGLSDINKINYSTDTTQLIGASLSRSNWNVGATGNATKGYFAGGVPGPVSTVDKLDYVTETTTLAQPLSGTRYGVIGVSGRCNAAAYTSNVL